MSSLLGSYSSLGYTFPIFDRTIETAQAAPRDVLLSQTLRFTVPSKTPVIKTLKPIRKTFHNSIPSIAYEDPLEDLLSASRHALERVLQNCTQSIQTETSSSRQHHAIGDYKSNRRKAISNTQRKISGAIVDSSSRSSTPIANKTIFFSPSVIKGTAAPSAANTFKDPHFNSKRKASNSIRAKLLKIDQASLFNIKQDNVQIYHDNYNDFDDSDYDHLACHADNIMRMAVDSTMLGSTFNSSFSSLNDSFAGGKADSFDKESRKNILDGLLL